MRSIKGGEDRSRAIELMIKCFRNTKGMTWMLKPGGNWDNKIRILMEYIVDESIKRDGAYISENGCGIIFMFPSDLSKDGELPLMNKLKLCFGATGIQNASKSLKIQKKVRELRPKDGLLVWILASDPDEHGHSSGYEIKKFMQDRSAESGLPVYAETTEARNKKLYIYLGFSEYATMENPYAGVTIYFMKREVEKREEQKD